MPHGTYAALPEQPIPHGAAGKLSLTTVVARIEWQERNLGALLSSNTGMLMSRVWPSAQPCLTADGMRASRRPWDSPCGRFRARTTEAIS